MKFNVLICSGILLLSLGAGAQTPKTPAPAIQSQSLKLGTRQEEALKNIRASYEARRGDVVLRLKAKKLEMAELLKKDDVEKAAIKAKLDELSALEQQLQNLYLDEIFDAKSQMNPAQFAAYKQRVLTHLYNRH